MSTPMEKNVFVVWVGTNDIVWDTRSRWCRVRDWFSYVWRFRRIPRRGEVWEQMMAERTYAQTHALAEARRTAGEIVFEMAKPKA